MNKILPLLLLSFCSVFLFVNKAFAYTVSDIEKHNTPSDCWVVFEDSVYDLTKYLSDHDRYLDIREWCGKDMTEDFKSKAGVGRDHRVSSYSLLERYNIGKVEEEKVDDIIPQGNKEIEEVDEKIENESSEEVKKEAKGYNMIIPFFVSCFLYWSAYFLIRKQKNRGPLLMKFNAFWNTVLILTLLIPSFGFGVFMVIRTKNPNLYNIDFEFMYWHVELSLVMGAVAISHFIQRIAVYFKQVAFKS